MTDLKFLELPLVLEGPCGGGVKEVVQRTGVVSHGTGGAGNGGITGNLYRGPLCTGERLGERKKVNPA